MRWRHWRALGVVCILAGSICLGGCQTVPIGNDAPVRPAVDPCSARLQNIGGAILMYYALHKRMPPTLRDAAKLADIDTETDLACPVSGKPYIYNPTGLAIPGTDKRIVVYDATAAHDGARHCLLMSPPVRGKAVTTDVQSFPEGVFVTLKPAKQ